MKILIVPDAVRIHLKDKYRDKLPKELNEYIDNLCERQSTPDKEHKERRLNANSKFKLGTRLWKIAIGGIERHRDEKAPLMPFLKSILRKSANREALIVLREQESRDESPWGDKSLDAPLSPDDPNGATVGDVQCEDPQTVRRRELHVEIETVVEMMDWPLQMAFDAEFCDDRRKVEAARFLGITRPTLDALVKKAKMTFARNWIKCGFTSHG